MWSVSVRLSIRAQSVICQPNIHNIYGNGSLNPRTFRPAIIGFVQILREKHTDSLY